MIKHIIFDLDGTLIDSSSGIVEAFNHALKKYQLPPIPAYEITPLIGFPVEMMFQKFTSENIPELKNLFREKATQSVVKASVALDGAHDTVVSLFERKFKLGIATTKIRSHIVGILDKLKWNGYFYSVMGGDEVKKVKLDPEQFEAIMKKLNGDRESTIVVGDTTNDLLAARALGLKTVAVRSPYGTTNDVLKHSPEYFIEGISELPSLLEKINSTKDNW